MIIKIGHIWWQFLHQLISLKMVYWMSTYPYCCWFHSVILTLSFPQKRGYNTARKSKVTKYTSCFYLRVMLSAFKLSRSIWNFNILRPTKLYFRNTKRFWIWAKNVKFIECEKSRFFLSSCMFMYLDLDLLDLIKYFTGTMVINVAHKREREGGGFGTQLIVL